MKIFLCGGGSGEKIQTAMQEYINLLDRKKEILYIPLAMEKIKYKSCFDWFKDEIKNYGINNFLMVKSAFELSKMNLFNYNSVYIGGGNIYKLFYEFNKYNNFDKLNNYIKNNGIIFGGSAGAIIFGKDMNSCKKFDKYNQNLKLKNTLGFNILNEYSFLCHLNDMNLKINKEYLLKYSRTEKIIFLPEEDVIYINDKKIKLFGDEDYLIFDKGKMRKGNAKTIKKDISNL